MNDVAYYVFAVLGSMAVIAWTIRVWIVSIREGKTEWHARCRTAVHERETMPIRFWLALLATSVPALALVFTGILLLEGWLTGR